MQQLCLLSGSPVREGKIHVLAWHLPSLAWFWSCSFLSPSHSQCFSFTSFLWYPPFLCWFILHALAPAALSRIPFSRLPSALNMTFKTQPHLCSISWASLAVLYSVQVSSQWYSSYGLHVSLPVLEYRTTSVIYIFSFSWGSSHDLMDTVNVCGLTY